MVELCCRCGKGRTVSGEVCRDAGCTAHRDVFHDWGQCMLLSLRGQVDVRTGFALGNGAWIIQIDQPFQNPSREKLVRKHAPWCPEDDRLCLSSNDLLE
jgi:hypothetical protein